MKLKSTIIFSLIAAAGALCSCNENEQFEGELYEKVIYVLSTDDYSFKSTHSFGGVTTGYVTVYCGGTKHLDKDVTVELEPAPEALDAYNHMYFDIDESRFAKALDPAKYTIKSFQTTLRADAPDNYALLPIDIDPEGLCPDSTYMIPLRIKSISDYRTNPAKEKVLYQVVLRNEFATMENTTYYQMTGTETFGLSTGEISSGISLTRIMAPISKNKIRFFAGTNTYAPGSVSKEEIAQKAVVAQLNDDGTVNIEPYADIEVEEVALDEYNRWYRAENGNIYVYLSYRYRTDVTFNGKTENCWVTMKETNLYKNYSF